MKVEIDNVNEVVGLKEGASKKKGAKQLKGFGPIKMAPRSRRMDGDLKYKVGNSCPLL